MKKILIPLSTFKINDDSKGLAHMARKTYLDKILAYHLEPRLMPTCLPDDMIDAVYNECDGILLMGGDDFDPKTYDEVQHEKTTPTDTRRDEVELRLIQKAIKDKKPVFGICRGCQAINIACGGSLHQHIPDIVPDEAHVPNPPAYKSLFDGKSNHPATVEKGSRLFSLINKEHISVTSAHHQSVNRLGNGLAISARSPRGIVEAIESIDPSFFLLGVQSHPETEVNGDLEPVFKAFAGAVEVYQKT